MRGLIPLLMLVALLAPFHSAVGAASFGGCFVNESHTKWCLGRFFDANAVDCVDLPSASNASLRINASCLTTDAPLTLRDGICRRMSWNAFAACLKDVSPSGTDVCIPFATESACQAGLGLLAACTGSLSGVCAALGFPLRNCTTMAASVAAAAMCPVANAVLLCANCTDGLASLSLTDQVLVAAANDGLRQANAHNTVLLFPNVTAYGSDATKLVADLTTFVVDNDISFFIAGNEMVLFDSVVDAFSAMAAKFFLTVLRIPLGKSLSEYPRVMFLSGRLDLLTFVAGYTLAVASKSKVILFSSHNPVTTFERSFFMGFASGAEASAQSNVSVLWGTTFPESMAAWGSLGVDGFSSGSAPQLIFPFMSNASAVGIFGDYLSDPATFQGENTTQSRHLLFSVTGNLNAVVTAQLHAGALGSFNTGLVSGDADAVDVRPCVYSCDLMTAPVLSAMRRSFSLVHRQGWQGSIDYTTSERIYSGTSIDADAPLLLTGASVVYAATPTLAVLDHERVVVLSLGETLLVNRVALLSLGVGHYQPMLLAKSSMDAPSQRTGYAVAQDPTTQRVFVSMGLSSSTLMDDVWTLSVARAFQLTPSWSRRTLTLSTLGGVAPAPRYGHRMVYSEGILMMYGGSTAYSATSNLKDLTDGTLYRLNTTSNEWMPAGASTGSGRMDHGMVVHRFPAPRTIYDTTCDTWVIVAGGATPSGAADGSVFDALLMYCPTANVWHRVQLSTGAVGGGGLLVHGRTSFCMVVLPARLGGALAIMSGDDATLPDIVVDVGTGAFAMDVDVLHSKPIFHTNTSSVACAPVANSAMQLSRDWAVVCIGNGSSSTALRYYWPPAVACAPFGASIASFSKLTCRGCAEDHYADAQGQVCIECQDQSDNPRCGERISKVLVGVTVSLSSVFLIVVLPLSFQGFRSFRSLGRKAQSERIGVELAESISSLQFERLDFLSTLKHPTRLQRAFLTILHILVTYMQFMPMWVLAGDRTHADRRANDGGDDGDGRASHTDASDEDESLPHRLPRGKPPRSTSPQLPASDGGSRSMIYRNGEHTNGTTAANEDALSTSSGQTAPLTGRNLEERLSRFQRRLLEGWVTVVHIKFPPMDTALGVRTMSHGQLITKPDVKALSSFYLGVTGCIDRFGGLIDAQWNHRMTVTFNGLRCHNDPELQAIRCALTLSAMAEHALGVEGTPLVPRGQRDNMAALGRESVVCCGIAAGFVHVGVVGKRFGKHATLVGNTQQEAMAYCCAAEACGQNIVLPFLKMKHSVGGKIALRIIGENKTYGANESTNSNVASLHGSCERQILACVLGRRRDVGAVQLQSVDCLNTAMDYIFNGAIPAAEGLLSSNRKSQLLDADRLAVREALQKGSIPVLDCSGLVRR